MKIKTWTPDMSDKETADLAYWERNMLALRYADGWYNDDIEIRQWDEQGIETVPRIGPRFDTWRRVLTLDNGEITFHIPDGFDVGTLAEVTPNWDGHTTKEKWQRVMHRYGIPAGGVE